MRLITLLFFGYIVLFGKNIDFNSLSTDFTQTIQSPQNSSIIYKGKLYAKKPNLALWKYVEPALKSIYVNNKDIAVVEPELEQVIVTKLDASPNISAILKNAKEVSKNKYKTTYENTLYTIILKDNLPHKIIYKDKLDNEVTILFHNTNVNIFLDDALFKLTIPKNYDVIQN